MSKACHAAKGREDTDVRPYKKQKLETDKTVNQEQSSCRRRQRLSADQLAKREWLAGEMLKVLNDQHSLGYYRKLAETVPEHLVFTALSEARTAVREGVVRKSQGALFTHLLRGQLT